MYWYRQSAVQCLAEERSYVEGGKTGYILDLPLVAQSLVLVECRAKRGGNGDGMGMKERERYPGSPRYMIQGCGDGMLQMQS